MPLRALNVEELGDRQENETNAEGHACFYLHFIACVTRRWERSREELIQTRPTQALAATTATTPQLCCNHASTVPKARPSALVVAAQQVSVLDEVRRASSASSNPSRAPRVAVAAVDMLLHVQGLGLRV